MDSGQIFTAVLGLAFVLGLALVTISLLKWLQLKGSDCCLLRKLKSSQNINIIEQRRLDAKNSLVLMEVDNIRYLLLVGADSHLLLNQKNLKEPRK